MKLKKMVLIIFSFAFGYKVINSIKCYLDTVAMINGNFPRAYQCISDIKKGRKDWERQIHHSALKHRRYIKVEKK